MWISKWRLERLEEAAGKVEELERRVSMLEKAGVKTEDKLPHRIVWPGVSITDAGCYEISAAKAVKLIADHLGLKFRRHSESTRYSVEKAKK